MEQIIYGDILFIINFSMDYLALFISAKILRLRPRTAPLILASAIGGLYAVITLFSGGAQWMTLLINIAISILMCYIAFSSLKGMAFLRASLLFYAVSFVIGGGVTALYNLLNGLSSRRRVLLDGDISELYSDIPPGWFVILAVVSALISLIWGRLTSKGAKTRSVRIAAVFDKRDTAFDGLVDSGNLLCDPIGGLPVVIAKPSAMKKLLPAKLYDALIRRDTDALCRLDYEQVRRVRMIPARTIGKDELLFAVIPDKLIINGVEMEGCIALGADDDSPEGYGGFEAVAPESLVR